MQHDSLSPVERIRLALQASPNAQGAVSSTAPAASAVSIPTAPQDHSAPPTDVYAWEITFDGERKSIAFGHTLLEAAEKAAAASFGSIRGIRRLAKRL